jgi:hypothetical protein
MKSDRFRGSVLLKVIVACALVVTLIAIVVPAMAAPKNTDIDKGGKYKVLNPAGIPIVEQPEMHGLAPRLDTLDGKTILFYQTEANDLLMPALLEQLEADYPTTTFDVIYTQAYGESTPTEEQIATYDALIRGVSW